MQAQAESERVEALSLAALHAARTVLHTRVNPHKCCICMPFGNSPGTVTPPILIFGWGVDLKEQPPPAAAMGSTHKGLVIEECEQLFAFRAEDREATRSDTTTTQGLPTENV